jgi:transposase-like protein
MARKGYPAEFRKRVLELIQEGRRISGVAADLEISQQTIYTWRRQAQIDSGQEAGVWAGARSSASCRRRHLMTRVRRLFESVHLLEFRDLLGECLRPRIGMISTSFRVVCHTERCRS